MTKLVKVISNKPGKSTTYIGDDGQTYTLSGDLAQRANNPGNISPVSKKARENYEQNFNVIGYIKSSNGPDVAVFATPEDGARAQAALWASPRYQNMTLAEAAKHWAASPYVEQLGKAAGVDPNTTRVADLSPQQMQQIQTVQTGIEGSRKLSIQGGANNTTIDRETFFGPNATQQSDAQLALMGPTGERLRQPAAVAAIEAATGHAPSPMPARPAAITGPQAAAPVPQQRPAGLVTLPSGKQVAPGTYPSSNPGHTITVNADGTVSHNLNPGEIAGVLDPLNEGKNTVVGPIIQRTLNEIAAQKAKEAAAAAPAVTQAGVDAVTGLGSTLGGFLGNAFSGAGNSLFGGGSKNTPTNAFASGSAAAGNRGSSGSGTLTPTIDPVGTGPGSYAALQQALASVASFKPTTTYTQQQMTSDNPAYLDYIAKQKADPIGAGPGSFASLQNALATTSGAAPPRTITTTQQVAHQAPNEQLRSVQQELAQQGYYTGAIDGLYGPKTAAAIAAAKAPKPVNALAPAPAAAAPQPAPAFPNYAGGGPVVGNKPSSEGYTSYNGDNGVAGNSGNWFNNVTGRG